MTESIQLKIQQISGKMKSLHALVLNERAKNSQMVAEIDALKSDLIEKNEELIAKEEQIQEMENQLVGMHEQSTVSVPDASLSRSHEIDELVKEIEYCIGQLRK
jgi:predicted  nucleic acid-binding Zn-ribbon protein